MFTCRRLITAYLIFIIMIDPIFRGVELGLSALGLGVNSFMQDSTNYFNQKAVEDTNRNNLQISRETNAVNYANVAETNRANAEQAELAYKRSLPTQQVANMMHTGMSRNAAIQALTGGGSYTAPVMQSATANAAQMTPAQKIAPHINFDALVDKIGSIPANAAQTDLLRQQLKDAKDIAITRINEEKRKQQIHELDVWQRMYGKDTATKLDAAATLINNALLEHGEDISHYFNYEDMIRKLGLSQSPIIRDIPYLARTQLEESVRSKFAESRAQQQQQNANEAASDSHKLSEIQRKKLRAELDDFNSAKSAREKEYKLRAVEANVRQIASSRNLLLDKDAIDECFEFDKDGNVILENGVPKIKENTKMRPEWYGKIRGFWNDVAEIVPVNVLSQIIRYALAK